MFGIGYRYLNDKIRDSKVAHWRSGWEKPKFFSRKKLRVSDENPTVDSHVLHYADTCFEGIMVEPQYNERGEVTGLAIPTLEQNVDRLFNSMRHLKWLPEVESEARSLHQTLDDKFGPQLTEAGHHFDMPDLSGNAYFTLTREQVRQTILDTVMENIRNGTLDPTQRIYIRPLAYKDDKFIELKNRPDWLGKIYRNSPGFIQRFFDYFSDHLKLRLTGLGVDSTMHDVVLQVSTRNVPKYLEGYPLVLLGEKGFDNPHAESKLGANYVVLGREKNLAIMTGLQEGLYYSKDGYLTEGGGENLFAFYKDGRIVTPSLETGGFLPGTKRGLVMEIAKALQINITEGNIPVQDLFNGNIGQLAFTGTWAGFNQIGAVLPQNGDVPFIATTDSIRAHQTMNTLKEQYEAVTKGAYVERDHTGIIQKVVPLRGELRDLAQRVKFTINLNAGNGYWLPTPPPTG